jgi:hypothetical protein
VPHSNLLKRTSRAADRIIRSRLQPRTALANDLSNKARYCHSMGSPLYGRLLESAAEDVEVEGACWAVLQGHERDPLGSSLPLRFLGAVHRLVLQGAAPALAGHFPTSGGDGDVEAAADSLRKIVEEHADQLRELVRHPVQTNEISRSAALLGGFLLVAEQTRLPLRMLEIGASGGLNLIWDRYRFEGRNADWGDPSSPVKIEWDIEGGVPPTDVDIEIAERRGCDLRPVDVRTEEGALTLKSYIWADRPDRLRLLLQGIEMARPEKVTIDQADGLEWLGLQLRQPRPGEATIVYHSVVMQFIPRMRKLQFAGLMRSAGKRATPEAPLAWLRMERGAGMKDILLTCWPGGKTRRVARAGLYGYPIHWG